MARVHYWDMELETVVNFVRSFEIEELFSSPAQSEVANRSELSKNASFIVPPSVSNTATYQFQASGSTAIVKLPRPRVNPNQPLPRRRSTRWRW